MSGDGGAVSVGVLSLHNSKETKAICNAVEALGHDPAWLRRENTSIEIRDGTVAVGPDVDVICNRLLLSNTEQPCELLGLASALSQDRPMLNSPENVLDAFHKFAAASRLAAADIRVPDALLALDQQQLEEQRHRFGDEAVYKTAIGTHGGGTWRVGPGESVNPMVGNRYAFLQELLEEQSTRNRDLRVYVVGGEILGAMYRYAPDNDWRTNVALGGDVQPADDLPAEAERLALGAADAVALDYAGVDLVEGPEGWHVLEVNPTAGFKGLYRATEVNPAPYIAALAIERVGGEVDGDRVEELAATLDDSRPNCAPRTASDEPDRTKTVGYTEEVMVSGTADTERVVAKSDTGATRTSIDTGLAATIGAGPIKSITKVKSGSMSSSRSRPVVDIVVGVGGDRHTVPASLEDRSHMEYDLLLGRDILEHYQVDVSRQHGEEAAETEE